MLDIESCNQIANVIFNSKDMEIKGESQLIIEIHGGGWVLRVHVYSHFDHIYLYEKDNGSISKLRMLEEDLFPEVHKTVREYRKLYQLT